MDEAKYVLQRLRGETEQGRLQAEAEYNDIIQMAEEERAVDNNQTSYWHMFFDWKSKLHLGRRVQLVVWLQIVQEWVGIAGVCGATSLNPRRLDTDKQNRSLSMHQRFSG